MSEIKYSIPDRSDYNPHLLKDENGYLDIGWFSGMTSDGRPYISEMWADEGMSIVTIFISAKDIENYTEEQLIKYLESEVIIRYYTDEKSLGADKWADPSENLLWSLNITIGVDDERYATTGLG